MARPNNLGGIAVIGFFLVVGGAAAALDLSKLQLIVIVAVGMATAWLAGRMIKDSGLGLLLNYGCAIVGAFAGTWLWGVYQLPMITTVRIIHMTLTATAGAVVVLIALRLIRRRA
jgi:uncharacterized membrane protein YeaQ/YmgE (transglycosylase-associated protein family)